MSQVKLRRLIFARQSGDAANQTDIAPREGLTRARVTQVMGMLRLAPEIQRHILSMPETTRRCPEISERALRPIGQLENPIDQKAKFQELIRSTQSGIHT